MLGLVLAKPSPQPETEENSKPDNISGGREGGKAGQRRETKV